MTMTKGRAGDNAMHRDLLTTLLLIGIVFLLVIYDVVVSFNGGWDYTITYYLRRADQSFPWIKLALAFVAGLLLGHLFLGNQ